MINTLSLLSNTFGKQGAPKLKHEQDVMAHLIPHPQNKQQFLHITKPQLQSN